MHGRPLFQARRKQFYDGMVNLDDTINCVGGTVDKFNAFKYINIIYNCDII